MRNHRKYLKTGMMHGPGLTVWMRSGGSLARIIKVKSIRSVNHPYPFSARVCLKIAFRQMCIRGVYVNLMWIIGTAYCITCA